jgi:hypothetical protein
MWKCLQRRITETQQEHELELSLRYSCSFNVTHLPCRMVSASLRNLLVTSVADCLKSLFFLAESQKSNGPLTSLTTERAGK